MNGKLQSAVLVLVLSVLCPGAQAPKETPEKVRTRLSGVWAGFAVEGKGEQPDRGPVKLELTISPEKIHGKEFRGEKTMDHGEGSYELDLTRDPPVLDATKTGNRKETWLGIYKLEGDTFHWCVGRRERPKDFETKKGAFLLIFKRKKG